MATIRKLNQKYQLQVRKNRYQTISKTFSSLSVAGSWAKVIEADIERQIYICPQDKETVGSLIERYEKEVVRNQRSAESTVYLLRTLNHHLGQFFIQDLSAKQLGKYRDLRPKDISPPSLKREMGVLRGMINHATRECEITLQQNRVSMVSLPKVGNGRDKRLEAGGEGKLLSASDELKRIIIVALETGMRRGEILNIKRSHIVFVRQTLLIPLTKTATPRTIPLVIKSNRGH